MTPHQKIFLIYWKLFGTMPKAIGKKPHQIAQKDEGNYIYDRIHAYLHRKEGDIFNAKYWYTRIKTSFPSISLDQEWANLVEEYLLKK